MISTPLQFLPYNAMYEWSDLPVDGVYHSATSEVSTKRLSRRIETRFAHIPIEKRRLIQRIIVKIILSSHGKRAWAIHAEAFGETLYVLRNTAHTLCEPSKRYVCRIVLEDVLGNWRILQHNIDMGWTEYALFAVTFTIGAFMAWTLYPYIHPPTLAGVCFKWYNRISV